MRRNLVVCFLVVAAVVTLIAVSPGTRGKGKVLPANYAFTTVSEAGPTRAISKIGPSSHVQDAAAWIAAGTAVATLAYMAYQGRLFKPVVLRGGAPADAPSSLTDSQIRRLLDSAAASH